MVKVQQQPQSGGMVHHTVHIDIYVFIWHRKTCCLISHWMWFSSCERQQSEWTKTEFNLICSFTWAAVVRYRSAACLLTRCVSGSAVCVYWWFRESSQYCVQVWTGGSVSGWKREIKTDCREQDWWKSPKSLESLTELCIILSHFMMHFYIDAAVYIET